MDPYIKQLANVRVPDHSTRVHKSECCFSFQTPKLPGGVYICLKNFYAFSKEYAELYHKKTQNSVFLHFSQTLKLQDEVESPPKKKPTILAIGVEGGFQEPKEEYDDHYSVVVLPDWKEFTYPNNDLPLQCSLSVDGVIKAQEAEKKDALDAWSANQELKVSKHSQHLMQLDNGVKISPKGNKCCLCDKTDNLWMNLTDGKIFCGRKNWDGTGGNNHAIEYYQQTLYPLAVKLGTITSKGADVFSYDEDDLVIDSNLKEHLLHFGINMDQWEKWDKTMEELQLDYNLSFDWNRIQENDQELEPLFGPSLTGLKNLGNSCYLASTMQVLFSLPIFQQRYGNQLNKMASNFDFSKDPTADLLVQLAKLGHGLLSGEYSKTKESEGIPPQMFKTVIGKGHPEFSTMRQQDALEFYQHLLTQLERKETVEQKSIKQNSQEPELDTSSYLKIGVEERVQCSTSNQVKYKRRYDNVISLPIPLTEATNQSDVDSFNLKKAELESKGEKITEIVRPRVPFKKCIEHFFSTETISSYYSSAIRSETNALKSSRIYSFPPYLMFQMRRFVVTSGWIPEKLDVFIVDVPEELDLSEYRGNGLQPGEVELPDEPKESEKAQPKADETIVSQLMELSFSRTMCEKAALATNNENAEVAANWLFAHMEDPDINDPIPQSNASQNDSIDPAALAQLLSMGFTQKKIKKALKETNNDPERATDWIFSHLDEPDDDDDNDEPQSSSPKSPQLIDGPPKYRLKALISHIGKNTSSGHYVCHIKKGDTWVHFNDSKVATSKNPPLDMAYLYLYERV